MNLRRFSLLIGTLMAAGLPAGSGPLPKADAQFAAPDMAQVRLGQLLFYDPILSGNRTVSCATCHHPRFATSDGVSLGLGDGGTGLGPERRSDPHNPPEQRIPRNAPALFNLGASQFRTLFHDGRLEVDDADPMGFRTPLGADMEQGFEGVLSAQTMFPVLSPDEMAGHYSENDVAQAVRQGFYTGPNGAWAILSARVATIPEYQRGFAALDGTQIPLHFSDISNAIAAFMAFEWRADDSPFDRYLRDETPLPAQAAKGLELFYGAAGCGTCHSGQFQTDQNFHAIGLPQIGPGKAARFERHKRDEGRMRVTGAPQDAYRFRTPSLRNVAHTAPYGHNGAYGDLRAMVRHHLTPETALRGYTPDQAMLPALDGAEDFSNLYDDAETDRIAAAIELPPVSLTEPELDAILAFLNSLSDPVSLKGRLGVPEQVPSGLPVE
ncbi:methylamine utilization protein MauG [Amylibacter cionae]|uniref:Methylamine utilization protein MauG n=2 Tax=Neptunicoccus cionae TaxID=2035344 RepID=A0A916VSR1_9RHOB|nr:methylamine utilization protein MauG [Amylibacter cionae]